MAGLKFRQRTRPGSEPTASAAPTEGQGAAQVAALTSPGLAAAEALELAAAEMALAASTLVAAEKRCAAAAAAVLPPAGAADGFETLVWAQSELELLEGQRTEAAQALERRMSAMEAALASCRAPRDSFEESLRQRRKQDMLSQFAGVHERFTPGDLAAAAAGPAPLPPPPGGQAALEAGDDDLPSAASGSGPGVGNGSEIILQGFDWDSHTVKPCWYDRMRELADSIAASGFTIVWMPPPTNSVSPQGYLPRDLYDLNSGYGSESALRATMRALHDVRVKCVADIVINHRCAHSQKDGKWNQFGGRLAWDESAVCRGNPEFGGTGRANTGEPYPAAPNIDHTNEKVRESLCNWLGWMRGVGFDGWRFDYVKGYGGEFTRAYIDASVPKLAFGEYWDACSYTNGVLDYNQDSHRQRIVNWCDKTGGTAAAFDFTTKAVLQEAVLRSEYWRLVDRSGRMPGMAGMWAMRAVTFVENHDTGPPLAHWPFPQLELAQGYAYILTHPGTPCVFWDHWDASKQPGLSEIIRHLIGVRKRARISAKSKLVVLKATTECYAACIDGKVAMKIGWGDFSPNNTKHEGRHWDRVGNGRNWAVWTADGLVPKEAIPAALQPTVPGVAVAAAASSQMAR